ncbi:MAG: Hpt domain-containing protein [Desulfuromonadales bacterium]
MIVTHTPARPTSSADTMRAGSFPEKLPGIDIPSVLARVKGNHSLVRTIIIEFRTVNLATVSSLRQAIAGDEREATRSLVHTLKGLAGTIGAKAVAATAIRFENAVGEGNEAVFPELLDTLEEQMTEVFEAAGMLEMSDTVSPSADHTGETAVFDRDVLAGELGELYALLGLNRVSAAKMFSRLKPHLPWSEERENLEKQIAGFDFKGAQVSLELLAERIGITFRGIHE